MRVESDVARFRGERAEVQLGRAVLLERRRGVQEGRRRPPDASAVRARVRRHPPVTPEPGPERLGAVGCADAVGPREVRLRENLRLRQGIRAAERPVDAVPGGFRVRPVDPERTAASLLGRAERRGGVVRERSKSVRSPFEERPTSGRLGGPSSSWTDARVFDAGREPPTETPAAARRRSPPPRDSRDSRDSDSFSFGGEFSGGSERRRGTKDGALPTPPSLPSPPSPPPPPPREGAPSPDAAALARSLARQTRVLDSLRRAREARDAELRRVMESLDRAGVA